MSLIVPRTCTEVPDAATDAETGKSQDTVSRPIETYRSAPAYVLLGDAGSGKTTALNGECSALGEAAHYVTARDFLTFDPTHHPEWRGKTLFIDALDERRAGLSDVRTPFDEIRARLDALGKPRFRLSCRAADWLGENDRQHLTSVTPPNSKVTILRLDSLTNSDIKQILNARVGIDDAETFITSARDRGVDGLLDNPQSLNLLADVVVREGSWPKSRLDTFRRACLHMAGEHNEEHRFARQPLAVEEMLDAAGRLCAALLISGGAGCVLHPDQVGGDYLHLGQCEHDHPELLRLALSTKLFTAKSEVHFTPIHRHIAEFLGAWHLSRLIKDGLTASRVISLITGHDGIVVTELRGLSAWLAALCENARFHLITRDPIGVGLYGDISEFSLNDKLSLLASLNHGLSWPGYVFQPAAAFGALATPAMESALKKILKDPCRSDPHQIFTGFVLDVLSEGIPLPGLSETLLDILHDGTRWPRISLSALDAFVHNCQDESYKTNVLRQLLDDIHTERVPDPDNELLGTLLIQLYPHKIPLSEVFDYLFRNATNLVGRYWQFWWITFLERSSDLQIGETLDKLQQQLIEPRPTLEVSDCLSGLPQRLLEHGLTAVGDQLDAGRLYNWLGVARVTKDTHQIRSWLQQRPEVQKKVIMEGLHRWTEADEVGVHAFGVYKRLYGASLPCDFGLWCLKQAVAIMDTKPQTANFLFHEAVVKYKNQTYNQGLSLEQLEQYAARNKAFKKTLSWLLYPRPISELEMEHRKTDEDILERLRREDERRLRSFRTQEAALRENRALPNLLFQIAQEYFARFAPSSSDDHLKPALGRATEQGDERTDRVRELLCGDQSLTDTALRGLCGVVDRNDVPEMDEIIRLKKENRLHFLSLPFLAGLEEFDRTGAEDTWHWDERRILTAIAFYYCAPHAGYCPRWYRRLLKHRPETVAVVQVKFAISELRSGRDHVYKLRELAYDEAYAEVARHASLRLLRSFPVRCTLKQITILNWLLSAALQHGDRASFKKMIANKLLRKSMTTAQRVSWLATATVVSPDTYRDKLERVIGGKKNRIRHLVAFFYPGDDLRISISELDASVMDFVIRLVGGYVAPSDWFERRSFGSRLVQELIRCLAESSDMAAGRTLDTLLADPALSSWHLTVAEGLYNQRVIRRDAGYRHPHIEEIISTLHDGLPSNAGDLAALVTDRLRKIAYEIRTSNTNDWRQYWNVNRYGRPCTPKPENSCRDALLSDLRQRLPPEVSAEPEGRYANDRRADIRVACRDIQVPVEIKRNQHQALWSAVRNQLIAAYVSTSAPDGYGIYLVFWFGTEFTQTPSFGDRPDSPDKLQERLEAGLSHDQRRKISVCVVDVSVPSHELQPVD